MGVTVKRAPSKPAPPPAIDAITVSNYGHSSPWNLSLDMWTGGMDPLVRITDDKAANHFALYLTPDQARELADALDELATQTEAAR